MIRGPFLDEQLRTFARVGFVNKMKGYLRDTVDTQPNKPLGSSVEIARCTPIQRIENAAYKVITDGGSVQVSMAGILSGLAGRDTVDPLQAVAKAAGFTNAEQVVETIQAAATRASRRCRSRAREDRASRHGAVPPTEQKPPQHRPAARADTLARD